MAPVMVIFSCKPYQITITAGGRKGTLVTGPHQGGTLVAKQGGVFSSFSSVKVIPVCHWHAPNLCIGIWGPGFWGGQN